ncbi:MAG: hypothetical protein J2O49_11690, partial [Sciscionella sp.]|nr:hypothetical protein [Sciscionella sp.]
PQMGLQRYTPAQQAAISGFAKQVIKQQPGDYLALVGRDTAKYLLPGQPVTSWDTCVGGWWAMPAQLTDNSTFQTRCKALMTYPTFNVNPVWPPVGGPSRSRAALAWYSSHGTVPHIGLGITVLLALAGIAWRWRRPDWRADLPAVLLVGSGLGMLVVGVATSEYSVRYGIPSTVLMTAGAALALYRLRTVFPRWRENRSTRVEPSVNNAVEDPTGSPASS